MDEGLLSPVTARTSDAASDSAVLVALVEAEAALTRALASTGAAPRSAGLAVGGLDPEWAATLDVAALARDAVAGGNPVIPLIPLLKQRVAEFDADAAAWIHRGATSQDILDTALMVVARSASERAVESLGRAARALADLAERHRDDPAAARTLTQHAVPTTIGARAAGWLRGIVATRRDLSDAAAALPAQLAGAGGTLASFVELFGTDVAASLPAAFAAELGLAAPDAPWHTDRRPVTRLGDALAGVIASTGVFAGDVATLSRTEIAEVSVAGGGGSSAMPQKQNPVEAVLIRSAALRAPGLAAQLQLSAGLALDERPAGAWHAEWPALRDLLQLAVGTAALAEDLASGLVFDVEGARANLGITGGLIVSERLGIVLTPLVGKARFDALIREASGGADLAGLVRALPEASVLDVDDLVDPARYTGLAGQLVDAAVRRARQEGIR